jgi:UDP-glucose 4-epimerase
MIAITGSTGFIGKYISDELKFPQKRFIRHPTERKDFTAFIGDLNQKDKVDDFVKDCHTLLHLAWVNNPWTSNNDILADISNNLSNTVYLFESFAKMNPDGHILFSSSGGNMYQGNFGTPYKESDIPQPWTSYSVNKLSAENYLKLFCKKYGVRSSILRISNPYGALLPSFRMNGLIGVIFSKLLKNEPLQIIDSLESVRDYIHLEDLKRAVQLLIENPPEKHMTQIFNISYGQGYSLQQIINGIEEITQKKIVKNYMNQEVKPSYSVLCHQRLKDTFNWSPQIDLHTGLIKMWENLNQPSNKKTD